jgi:itaconate CoA-transferase
VTGTAETPSKVGISVADISGGMYAYSGILTALYQRERTSEGAALDVALFDTLGEWMSHPMYLTAYGGKAPSRNGATHASIAPYGPFPAGDGRAVNLAVQNEREWARFCEIVLENPEVAADPRFATNAGRVAEREALTALIIDAFSNLTADEVIERLDRAQIANAAMNTVQEFIDHPQLAARDRWRDVDSPAGPLRALLPPVDNSNFAYPMRPIPALGGQTQAILGELGYGKADIERLREAGVV